MLGRNRTSLVLALLAALALVVTGAIAKPLLRPNPADDSALVKKRLDPNRYDGADGRCKDFRGMRKLIRWMKRNTKRNTIYGTLRCGDPGLHGSGRALDWMLDARKKRQKRKAMRVINTWMARDKRGRRNALARRMGVQLIIYNCRWWQAGDRGWSWYSACSGGRKNADPTQGHIDHIHIELTKRAARARTSFWQYGTSGGKKSGGGGKDGGGGIGPARRASGDAHAHPPLHPPEPSPVG